MNINDVKSKYTTVRVLDEDDKGVIEVVRSGGKLYVLRTMNGNISAYTTLRNIPSPFIPKIEYAATDGEKTVVVEEYIRGEKDISSLTDEKEIVTAFCELCDVLTLLHSRGIVHRDIKPSNILIAPDGHIRLIDFDASRRYDDSKDNDTRYLGTKGYAPPEQFGYSQTNAASDIYSLGVTLKTVLGKTSDKRRYRYIIRKCTEFDPKNRYQSAASVKRALIFNSTFNLPILILAIAVISGSIYLGELIYNIDYEKLAAEYLTTAETTASAETEHTTTVTETTLKTEPITTSAPPETTAEESTILPETEETTEETTEEITSETTTESDTNDTSSTITTTVPTSVTTLAPTTKTTAAKTTKTAASTTAKVTTPTTAKAETTVPSVSETVSKITSPTGLPSGISVDLTLTCYTDKTKVPTVNRIRTNKNLYFDELAEPYEFVNDESVLGTWNMLAYTSKGIILYDKMKYDNLKKNAYYDTYPQKIVFNNGGAVDIMDYQKIGNDYQLVHKKTRKWTYGLIKQNADPGYYYYESYYLYVDDESGEEYLFVQLKNGDYSNAKNPDSEISYCIYERDKSV